ncbi:hypothetical protein JVT61DRAFT_12066 [Boletus reticuloceps]|uniref:Uncharacterized protein n=1 Tax=Boletus reticuloceps TaxID=495285 RepID=A0A8I2YEJ7_9AGAM|nr:hypothetical protein JVT61DRAFT_12066 [Boletus reticuloceps]
MAQCRHCGNPFKAQGLKKHEKSCQHRVHSMLDKERHVREFEEERQRVRHAQDSMSGPVGGITHVPPASSVPGKLRSPAGSVVVDAPGPHTWHSDHGDPDYVFAEQYVGGASQRSASDASMHDVGSSAARSPQGSDIEVPADFKTEHHPRSGCPPLFQSTEDFGSLDAHAVQPDEQPWRPFQTEVDLEFADLVTQAGLNASHVNALLSIISRVANKSAKVTFKNENELRLACDRAAQELTPFTKLDVTAEYQKELKTFEVHVRPLWDWALDLLNNPLLAPHFVWNAQHLHRHDGEEYKRFYTEPWTGDRWWDIQSCLSDVPNAVPFAFILYADKTRLSSHGSVKAYPVVAQCANLPIDIQNGEHFGSGCIVGWLPIVPEPAKTEQKKSWTNFERVIWHESFLKLLEALIHLSLTGYKHTCYDEVIHWLFPLILILSANYEEQCMMTLIRGTRGKCPCPVCLVPLEELCKLSKTFPMQTISQVVEGYEAYLRKKSEGEEILKALSLRPVENVFWKVRNSEPEEAVSFDRLHFLHGGLGGKHMFEELKIILRALGWDASTRVEERYMISQNRTISSLTERTDFSVSNFPRWRNLAHFNTIMQITFSDGNKLRDVMKQVFYAALNVLTQASSPEGYCLLRMLGTYLRIDSLIGLDVHTDKTLAMIDEELVVFGDELQQYIRAVKRSDITTLKLDWDFPKAHLWKHVIQDIQAKGVARNYSTRPNKKMHGTLKDAYADRSNGKDIEKQILRVDHHHLAIKLLRGRVEAESERQSASRDDGDVEAASTRTSGLSTSIAIHYLGDRGHPP